VRDIAEILEHWQAGRDNTTIARSLGVDRKTVRKYVEAAKARGVQRSTPATREQWVAFVREHFPEAVDRMARSPWAGGLAAHEDFIREQLVTNQVTTVWQRLVERTGLGVSLSTFRRHVRSALPDALPQKPVPVWRPEVQPGEEAQVDFAHMGLWPDPRNGKRHRVWAFIFVLSFSRHMFVRLVRRIDKENWLGSHVAAFDFLGGVPQRVLLDNLKGGVVKPDIYDPQLNQGYERLAAHYAFLIDPCRAARPTDKPRVERQVRYVRDSFWRGRTFLSLDHMNTEARSWCLQTAGCRIHGTTRRKPLEFYETAERPAMRELPPTPWELAVWTTAKVAPIAFYERTPQWCLRQAKEKGAGVFEAVRQLLAVNTLTNLRQAQGVLRLGDAYGSSRLDAACRRALGFGDPRYRTVKNILERGLDTLAVAEDPDESRLVPAHLRGKDAFPLFNSTGKE
jgi:transposase